MTRQFKTLSLAALLLILAVGTSSVRAWPDAEDGQCEGRKAGRCCAPVMHKLGSLGQLFTIAQAVEALTDDECPFAADKSCDDCPDKPPTAACTRGAGQGYSCPSPAGMPCPGAVMGCPTAGMPLHPGMPCMPPPGAPVGFPGCMPPPFAIHPPPPFAIHAPPPPMISPMMPMTPFQTMVVPPPPQTIYASPAPPEPRCYVVEMKFVEQKEGEKQNVLFAPKVTVLENEPAELSCGTSRAYLWKAGLPVNDMGHEGCKVGVMASPAKPGQVRLSCWMSVCALGDSVTEGDVIHEGRSQTTALVQLGKTTKLPCSRPGKGVRSWLEVTVKEFDENGDKSVNARFDAPPCYPKGTLRSHAKLGNASGKCAPACCDSASTEKCLQSLEKQVRYEAKEIIKATAARKTAARKKEMCFSVVESSECRQVGFCVGGKMGDLNPPGKLLSVNCNDTTMTCEKMAVEFPGYETVSVSVREDHVLVVGDKLKATAERVTAGDDGCLTLEGHVHVLSDGGNVDVKAGKVRVQIKYIEKTGVISNPGLDQD